MEASRGSSAAAVVPLSRASSTDSDASVAWQPPTREERSLFRGKGYAANAKRIKTEARQRSARRADNGEDDPRFATSSAELLASASAPLISREEIERAVSEQMATDPREISRRNEVVFITVAAVVCIVIFVFTAMAMEHPHWAANIRGALMLSPPPGYVPPQQPKAVWADTPGRLPNEQVVEHTTPPSEVGITMDNEGP